jgi:hypothetical protein
MSGHKRATHNEGKIPMTTTTVINGKTVTWTLTVVLTGEQTAADLKNRGFDGTYYMGQSVPSGRQKQRTALFVRSGLDGTFEHAL